MNPITDNKKYVILDAKYHFSIFKDYMKEYYQTTPFRFDSVREVEIFRQIISYIFERFSSDMYQALSETNDVNPVYVSHLSLPPVNVNEYIANMNVAKNVISLMLARDLNFNKIIGSELRLGDTVFFYETNPFYHVLLIY